MVNSILHHPVRDVSLVENMFIRAKQHAVGMQLCDIRFHTYGMEWVFICNFLPGFYPHGIS